MRGSARLDPGADGFAEAGAWTAGSITDKWVFSVVCGITWTPASTYAAAGPVPSPAVLRGSPWLNPEPDSTTQAGFRNAAPATDMRVCPAVRGISRTPSVHCRSNKAGPSCCSAGIGPARPRTRKHRRSQGLQCRIDHGQVGLSCGLWDNLDPSIHLRSGRAGPFSCCSAWIGPARPQVAAPQEPWPKTRDRPRTWESVLRSVESAGLPASTAVATRLVPPAVLRGSARLGPGPASTAEARACNAGSTTDKWVFPAVCWITWTPASTYAAAGPVPSPAVLRGSPRLNLKPDSTTQAGFRNAAPATDMRVCPAACGVSRTPSVHCRSNKAGPSCCSAWIGPAGPRSRRQQRSRGLEPRIDLGRAGLSCGPWGQQDSQRPLP